MKGRISYLFFFLTHQKQKLKLSQGSGFWKYSRSFVYAIIERSEYIVFSTTSLVKALKSFISIIFTQILIEKKMVVITAQFISRHNSWKEMLVNKYTHCLGQ